VTVILVSARRRNALGENMLAENGRSVVSDTAGVEPSIMGNGRIRDQGFGKIGCRERCEVGEEWEARAERARETVTLLWAY